MDRLLSNKGRPRKTYDFPGTPTDENIPLMLEDMADTKDLDRAEIGSEKGVQGIDHAERAAQNGTDRTGGGEELKQVITQQHHDYLMQRHGTTDLQPLPSMDPADPYNWSTWKVRSTTERRYLRSNQLTEGKEKRQSHTAQLPRHDDHLPGCCHYPGVRASGRSAGDHHPGR